MLKAQIKGHTAGNTALFSLGHLKIIVIFFYNGIIQEDTGVLSCTTQEVFSVKLYSHIAHKVGNIGHTLVLSRVGYTTVSLILANISQVLVGRIHIGIEGGEYIGFGFELYP